MAGRLKKPRKVYTEPGYWTAKRAILKFGRYAVDGRSSIYRALEDLRASLIEDLGGAANVCTTKERVVSVIAWENFLFESLKASIAQLPNGPVNKRKRSLWPLVKESIQIGDSLVKHCGMLGLTRIPKPVSTINPEALEKILATENEQAASEEKENSDESE